MRVGQEALADCLARLTLGRIERRILSKLALHVEYWVSTDALTDAVWHDHPNGGPISARNSLSVHCIAIRKKLVHTDWTIEGHTHDGRRLIRRT